MFMETSAKAGHNVKGLFKKIALSLPGMEKDPTSTEVSSTSMFGILHMSKFLVWITHRGRCLKHASNVNPWGIHMQLLAIRKSLYTIDACCKMILFNDWKRKKFGIFLSFPYNVHFTGHCSIWLHITEFESVLVRGDNLDPHTTVLANTFPFDWRLVELIHPRAPT